jgi:hypothetical protein
VAARCGRLKFQLQEAAVHILRREMTISHREFSRILMAAFKQEFKRIRSDQTEFENSEGTINLKLSAESSKRIGSIDLPITELTITFLGMTEEEIKDFMVRFDRSFQRGGG